MPRILIVRSKLRKRRAEEAAAKEQERRANLKRVAERLGLDENGDPVDLGAVDFGEIKDIRWWHVITEPRARRQRRQRRQNLFVQNVTPPPSAEGRCIDQLQILRRSLYGQELYTLRARYTVLEQDYYTLTTIDGNEVRICGNPVPFFEEPTVIADGLTLDQLKSVAVDYGWTGEFPDDL